MLKIPTNYFIRPVLVIKPTFNELDVQKIIQSLKQDKGKSTVVFYAINPYSFYSRYKVTCHL